MTLFTITVWHPDGERLTYKGVTYYRYTSANSLEFKDHEKTVIVNLPHEIREQ